MHSQDNVLARHLQFGLSDHMLPNEDKCKCKDVVPCANGRLSSTTPSKQRDAQQAGFFAASLMVNANVNRHNSQQPIHVLTHN